MRRPLILLTLAVAAALAACSSSSEPGWTYAPPTEAPASQPAASGDASAPPASEAPASGAPASEAPASGAPASEAPASAPASEAPSGEAPSGGAGDVVTLTALQVNWVEKELAAPADTAFTLHLDNQDAGVPHDVVIKDGTGAEVAKSAPVTGVAATDLAVPALAAGAYQYVCSFHPAMTGTLTAGS